ncbi:hypothetical protein SLS60_003301 [Paraconiothyrium brasiliense]|uniref:Uncharacterized protein n=1 Tax=Paraconiothyrium brasiliense TaxID=300254 RepID=A0ABR3RVA5_9PLEO
MSTFTNLSELPVDDNGCVPVGAGASIQKPVNVSNFEKLDRDGSEDVQSEITKQVIEYNNNPIQQDIQTCDQFALTSAYDIGTQQFPSNMGMQQFSNNVGMQQFCNNMGMQQFSNNTSLASEAFTPTLMGYQGGIAQCDFTQESSDLNNALSFSNDAFGLVDFSDNVMSPINNTAVDPAQPMSFNDEGNFGDVFGNRSGVDSFDTSSPVHFSGFSDFVNATSISLDQPKSGVAFSGHGLDNASIQHFGPEGLSTALSIDQPQMRAPQQWHTAVNDTRSQKAQGIKDQTVADDQAFAQAQAFARANVRTVQANARAVQEAGQRLFEARTHNQQSFQVPSGQATSILPTPTSTKKLSANQLGKQPVPQPSLSSPAELTPSNKRPRPVEIQIPSEPSKRARIDAPGPPPFAAEVESDASRGRAVKVLFKTPWEQMTQIEKARILLPMMIGKHPIEFEKEEMQRGLSYGTMRQREALQKTMRLRDEAVAEAQFKIAPKNTLTLAEMDEDDEEAALKARLAEIEANKKAKVAEEKKRVSNEKRAATMRRKRQEKKEADQLQLECEKELEDIARREDELEAHREASIAEERGQAAGDSEQDMREQVREPYAHIGFATAQPYMG